MRRVEGVLEFHRSNTKLVEYFLFTTRENESALFKITGFYLMCELICQKLAHF